MRLEVRVTLWLALLLGASATLTLVGMAWFEAETLERQTFEAGRLLALASEGSLEVSMLNNSPEDVRRVVRNVEEGTLIGSVAVYGRDGEIWVSSSGEDGLDVARTGAFERAIRSGRLSSVLSGEMLSVFVPVENKPECAGCHDEGHQILGAVEVTLDEGPFRADLSRGARYSLYLAIVPLAAGIVASVWAVRRRLLKPLAQIGGAAAELGAGELDVRLPAFREWELDSVASTFNEMAETLQREAADLARTVEQLRSDMEGIEAIQGLLSSGAGLEEVLGRSAAHLGEALGAEGVRIWLTDPRRPEAAWGSPLPDEALVEPGDGVAVATSAGALEAVAPAERIAWAAAPARRGGRTLAIAGVSWDPPRPLGPAHRDLLSSLVGLVAVAVEDADLLVRIREKEESLQALLRKTLVAQEEERRRISRELHDETSQVLSALMMNVDLLESQVPVSGEHAGRLEAVKSLAEEAARNLDKMLLDLRPALLDELGPVAALRWYVAQVREVWNVPVEFEAGRISRLPEHLELAAFRIVQEAIGNAARHARAGRIRVQVAADQRTLRLTIEDDGVGFDVAEASARARGGEAAGLLGMMERAELAGGRLDVRSEPGAGTTVVAELPLSGA